MPRQLRLEGTALEPLLEQARREHGADVQVVSAQRVRTGGVGGFFAREHYEVTVTVPDPLTDGPAPVVPAAPVGPTIEELLAAADAADAADTAPAAPAADVPAPRRAGRPVSTETRGFDEVLAALRADLLGPGDAGAVTARPAVSAATADARAWAPAAVPAVAAEPVDADPAPTAPLVLALDRVAAPVRASGPTTPAPPRPGPRGDAHADLVALAVAVGASPRLAGLAADDVLASGCTAAHLRVPLLAACLGSRLALDTVPLHAGAGELVVVTGPARHVGATAAAVARRLGRARTARWDDTATATSRRRPATVSSHTPAGLPTDVVGDVRQVPELVGRARGTGSPLVLEVVDADAALLAMLDPDLVVGVVVATDSGRRAERHPLAPDTAVRPDLVAVVDAALATAPAVSREAPVTLVDGQHATEGAWTGVLLDALRWAEPA